MLSLPKCNSSMCSELIPGFSVLKRLSSCRHAHLWPQTTATSEHRVLGPNMMQTFVVPYSLPHPGCVAPSRITRRGGGGDKWQAERRLSSMTCWETIVCRRWRKSGVFCHGYISALRLGPVFLRYCHSHDLCRCGTAVWVPQVIGSWSRGESPEQVPALTAGRL